MSGTVPDKSELFYPRRCPSSETPCGMSTARSRTHLGGRPLERHSYRKGPEGLRFCSLTATCGLVWQPRSRGWRQGRRHCNASEGSAWCLAKAKCCRDTVGLGLGMRRMVKQVRQVGPQAPGSVPTAPPHPRGRTSSGRLQVPRYCLGRSLPPAEGLDSVCLQDAHTVGHPDAAAEPLAGLGLGGCRGGAGPWAPLAGPLWA